MSQSDLSRFVMVTKDSQDESTDGSNELPEAQLKLRHSLLGEFGDTVVELPPHAWSEYGLTVEFTVENAVRQFETLRDGAPFLFNMLVDITCVDWLDQRENRFEVIYHLLSLTHHHRLCVKVNVPEEKPEVGSVRSIWPAANFLEREAWDMFGVEFVGHGDLRRILMYDEFVGHPLRKDYPVRGKQPRVPLRVPELRNTSVDLKREQLVSLPVRQRLK